MGLWDGLKNYWGEPDFVGKGYVFDRRIFRGLILLIIVFCIVMISVYGLKTHVKVSCPENNPRGTCINPLYADEPFLCMELGLDCANACKIDAELCHVKFIPPGVSYGGEKGRFSDWGVLVVLALTVFAFAYNHVKNNERVAVR